MKSRLLLSAMLLSGRWLVAQTNPQPPPFQAPNPPTPAAPNAPGQKAPPAQQTPVMPPDVKLPNPDQSTVDQRDLPPLAPQPVAPAQPSAAINGAEGSKARPLAEGLAPLQTGFFHFVAPYRAARVPLLPLPSTTTLQPLVRDGKLYLSLHDALALAIENNLDVEVSRYNLLLADTDLTRAKGGGTLRGIGYTVQETAPGVGETTTPLLITQANTTSGNTTNVNLADLSQVTQSGSGTSQTLSQETGAYVSGPPVPLYDPDLVGIASYLRRSNQVSLEGTTTTSGATSQPGAVDYINAGVDFQQGFSPGTQIDAFEDNASQVLYGSNSQFNPFHTPSVSFTVTQPLLRGAGTNVNLRYIRIARIAQKQSLLVFEQQLLETVYGVSRLYYDLVSLGENVAVKEEALAAAQKLYEDDKSQTDLGTLAPVELTRAQALLSSSRLELVQAKGEYHQQEVILREQLLRRMDDPAATFSAIIPTDHINIPDQSPVLDVPALISDAITNRPDLVQAGLQIHADEISVSASRNAVRPALNAYANVQTRGSSLVPYQSPGLPANGVVLPDNALFQGGLKLSTIVQGGIQLNLPLRNRIAQADAQRDQIQLRQSQARRQKLENDVRQQIENAAVALENAHQSYGAAVESRNYQEQLLQAEKDKFSVGESTNYLIVQDEAYLAQARSTEVAARSNWMKARMALDRALGDLLTANNIVLDDAIKGSQQP